MTVIAFPEFTGIEIVGGTVETATITDENGTRPILTDVGRFFYYVNVMEAGGGCIGMWHGTDHAEAVRQANILALDFGGKVRDRTQVPA